MPTLNITNIPEEIYNRLEGVAEQHNRSLNSEVIMYLKYALFPKNMSLEDKLNSIQSLRSTITPNIFTIEEIEQAINEGRP